MKVILRKDGYTVRSNKKDALVKGNRIDFADGSYVDLTTFTIVTQGSGSIKVTGNGKNIYQTSTGGKNSTYQSIKCGNISNSRIIMSGRDINIFH
jgi:hypothetical protein